MLSSYACFLTRIVGRYNMSVMIYCYSVVVRLGGLIPVLSVLQCLDIPKAWAGRWATLSLHGTYWYVVHMIVYFLLASGVAYINACLLAELLW